MAGSLTQSTHNRASGDAGPTVGLTGVASGACLVLKVGVFNQTVTGVSGGGATWNKRANVTTGSVDSEIWIGHNSTGGSVTISMTLGAGADSAFILEEWAGLGTSDPFTTGEKNNATGTSTSPESGATPTLGQADSVKLTAMAHGGGTITMNPRAGDGDTEVTGEEAGDSGMVCGGAYQILSATTAVNGRWTIGSSQAWAACVVVLKATGGAASPTGNTLHSKTLRSLTQGRVLI